MKKKNIIILIIAIILVVIGSIASYLFIPRDTFNEKAMELYEDHSPVCYNIEEQENIVLFTVYYGYDEFKDNITKVISKYEFENDVLIKISEETYFRNNFIAILEYESYKEDIINYKRKGNIIYGEHEIWEDMKNNTKQEVIDKMSNIYKSIYILTENDSENVEIYSGVEYEKSEIADLYLKVFENIMSEDKALDFEMEYISIDMYDLKELNNDDKNYIKQQFKEKYDVQIYDYSLDECFEKGLGYKDKLYIDGILLQIDDYTIGKKVAEFNVMKYKSGTGAVGGIVKAEKNNNIWNVERYGNELDKLKLYIMNIENNIKKLNIEEM